VYYWAMIGTLRGTVTQTTDRAVILDVNGVGYLVFASTETLGRLKEGSPAALWTYLAVRENALDLFGFLDRNEKDFFELLLSVPGIGPRSALAILSLAPPEVLRKAILSNNTDYLTKVSGIGRKSAEKIVIELKDKIGKLAEHEHDGLVQASDVIDALKALGYPQKDVREAVQKLPPDMTDTSEQIKEALKILSRQ